MSRHREQISRSAPHEARRARLVVVRTIFTVHNRVCVTRVFISLLVVRTSYTSIVIETGFELFRLPAPAPSLSLSRAHHPPNVDMCIGFQLAACAVIQIHCRDTTAPSQGGIYTIWRVILLAVDLSILTRTHTHERASHEQITEEAPSTRLHCLRRHGNIHDISNVWSRFLSQCHYDGEKNAALCAKIPADPISETDRLRNGRDREK